MQKRVLRQLDHSAREASIETKETTQIPPFVRSYCKQQFRWVSKRVEVVGPFGMSPKTGAPKSISASLLPLLDRGNYGRGSKNGVLVTS